MVLYRGLLSQSLGSEGVHILDPFTGTGTFITRLLQSGLIPPDQLARKYHSEIRANEIVLLAYYIAAINIEAVYHSIAGGEYQPFKGICLTDTFQLYEAEDLLDALLLDNSDRRKQQKALDIRVIVGNPPYSAGQNSANDDAANIEYLGLDERISETYIAKSLGKGGKRSSYDSYIRAIRWASDRIGKSGVIGFVTNAGWLESSSADGLRKALAAEFSSLYVFHLRGNQRTSGELSRQEGGKIFGSGSRAPIAISLLVKNPSAAEQGQIHFHHVGDYLNREEKLGLVAHYKSIAGITQAGGWQTLTPDDHGDWLNQRDDRFSKFLLLGTKKLALESVLFEAYSNGVVTGRDAWVYNYSKTALSGKCREMIVFYNAEIDRFKNHFETTNVNTDVQSFVIKDTKKISWGGGNWQARFAKFKKEIFEADKLAKSLYRPFTKMWHYGGKTFNHSFYSMPRIFPNSEAENLVITVNAKHAGEGQIALIMDSLPDLHSNGDSHCFPLYLYDESETDGDESLFTASSRKSKERTRRSALTDEGLEHFRAAYPNEKISKEDIFYYIYGLLHSPDYRERFADNLSKEIPRIPCVKRAVDFRAFEQAGRDLAKLHVNYESVKPYRLKMESTGKLTSADYRVEKMRYSKDKDKTTLHYNESITLTGIPLEAYEYVVNGKPALDWVVERQGVSTHKESGIVNDANDWAIETMKDPQYPLDLFCRVVTVSLDTMKIVNSLPKLDI